MLGEVTDRWTSVTPPIGPWVVHFVSSSGCAVEGLSVKSRMPSLRHWSSIFV